MANAASPPTQDSVIASLAAAVDAAFKAYQAAGAANPDADTSQLYLKYTAASQTLMDALKKKLDPAAPPADLASAQADLDKATTLIKNELTTIKNISTWLSLLDNLVQLAAKVAPFFI